MQRDSRTAHNNKEAMYKSFKWIMDRLLALIALSVTAPLLAVIALLIVIDSPGSPFIVQKRDGYKKKTIKVIKFRTMFSADFAFDVDHAVIDGSDKKVTRVGRFLRRSKLDELPQLINILKADMSFVGPRPLLPVYTPRYERWEFQKFAVKPGLTGLSQVKGNGYLSVKSRSYYDALYTERISLLTDFKIILMTIGVIFRGEGAFKQEATPKEIEEIKRRHQSPEGILTVGEIIGDATHGGVRSAVMNYLTHADLAGIELHLFTYGPSEIDDFCKEKGWTVHYLPNFIRFPFACRAFRKVLRERKFDVIHSHLTSLSLFPLRVAKQEGVEVRICHAHSATSRFEKTAFVKNFLKRFAPHYATALFACSEHAAKWMYGKRAEKALIVKNAIDLNAFRFDEEKRRRIRAEIGASDDTLVVGCVARLVYQKNIPLLLQVVNRLKEERDVRLLLVGSGKKKKQTERMIRSLDLEDCVFLTGEQAHPEQYYSAMDLFLLTSRYEGLGMVAIEAQANGLPCLLSEAVPEEVKIGKNVRFVAAKPEAFLSAIPALELTRSENAAALANAGYDISLEADKLIARYRLMCENAFLWKKKEEKNEG